MPILKRVTVYLEPELHRALKHRGAEEGRSVSDLISAAVKTLISFEESESLATPQQPVDDSPLWL